MIIYQGYNHHYYNSNRTTNVRNISKRHSKRVTSRRTLNRKNKLFLKKLGFKVK